MEAGKCPTCPYVKVDGELKKPFGMGKKIHTTKSTEMAKNHAKKHRG